ncbi:MAG TPA: L-histidine N(alpha)-methyltransferase [Myxococcota bacterium]|nr:L-histidine N(alpha)-methyltransferase [Myxococcota bacterium]
MSQTYRVLDTTEISAIAASRRLAQDVLLGLSERPRRLSSRYFYDDVGSRLFQRITDLEDYYPTRCEAEILQARKNAILDAVGDTTFKLVDLGVGDGRKTDILLSQAVERGCEVTFVPIDISEAAMQGLVDKMGRRFPTLKVSGVVAEYFDGLHSLRDTHGERTVVLFLGSNIGNFRTDRARVFLRQMWDALADGDLVLIGFDLKKDIDVLLRAYNDEQGITRDFNLNLLARLNRELGADFDLESWRHFGTYNVFTGAMESYLVSQRRQTVTVRDLRHFFDFDPYEPIHTEYSYKYLDSDIEALAAATGFQVAARWYDRKRWFADMLWRVDKPDI